MRFTPIFGILGLFAVALVAVGASLSQPPESGAQIAVSSDRRAELAGAIESQGYACPEAKSAVYEKSDQSEVSVVVECGAKGAAVPDAQYRVTMLPAGPTKVERKS